MTSKSQNAIREQLDVGAEISVPSLPDIAYAKLRESILTSKLEAGTPLRQEDLASAMGISRLPIREALTRLEADGLVVQRPRRGYIVASLDPSDIEDIFDIRAILEERAGYLATKHRTEADIAAVARILRRMEKLTGKDVHAFADENHTFHARLFESSGRRQLCRMLIALNTSVDRYVRVSALVAKSLERAKADHRRIFEAFRQGNAESVARLSRAHCKGVATELLGNLRNAQLVTTEKPSARNGL
jgi:DNA-binding GntR family transcriptional regulator